VEPFTHGILFLETFASVAGEVQVLAAIKIDGKRLRLEELAVAPATTATSSPGYSVLRGIMEQITGAAYAQGFEVVEFEGERVTGVSIGRIAHVVRRTR